jgi:alginate O-acetyltransferase complex protein AlgI
MRIFTWQNGIIQIYAWVIVAITVVFISTIVTVVKKYSITRTGDFMEINGFYPRLDLSKFWHLVIFFIVVGIIIGLAYTGANPFIYFQF